MPPISDAKMNELARIKNKMSELEAQLKESKVNENIFILTFKQK